MENQCRKTRDNLHVHVKYHINDNSRHSYLSMKHIILGNIAEQITKLYILLVVPVNVADTYLRNTTEIL